MLGCCTHGHNLLALALGFFFFFLEQIRQGLAFFGILHDIGEKFLEKDGTLSKEIMPDYLHLSQKGYAIWAESIEKDLKEMLK